jgi:hypothetical protein
MFYDEKAEPIPTENGRHSRPFRKLRPQVNCFRFPYHEPAFDALATVKLEGEDVSPWSWQTELVFAGSGTWNRAK